MKQSVLNVYIKKPILTEKSLNLYNNYKICTFFVDINASKKQIGYEFENLFGIKPIYIKTSILKSRVYRRSPKDYRKLVLRKKIKKAYISIGDSTLDIFENIK